MSQQWSFIVSSSLFLELEKRPIGRGGGRVVSVLAYYSDDPSSNPATLTVYYVNLFEKTESKQTRD